MRKAIYILLFWCLLPVLIFAQLVNRRTGADTARFKVYGACEAQCKPRIEAAAKARGVQWASWDVNTQILSVVYDTASTKLLKIQQRIVAAGHDTENKKANNTVYNALPSCCHYRELLPALANTASDTAAIIARVPAAADSALLPAPQVLNSGMVKGLVLESNRKGSFVPLGGASVYWLGTQRGTSTDSAGVFSIQQDSGAALLVISYTGFQPDTLAITNSQELRIILGNDKKLGEVVITSRQRAAYISSFSVIRTQVITERELFKAACCNLSESFETNPSVDVSYNDAVTGSKQIQLLGLSGNYTQLTVENLPGPRGIATPLGLNSIAGPWVESIQLVKGIGSVANGYESIAGQINVELKKPENSEQLYANIYVDDIGKTDLNLNLAKKISKNWSTGILLHNDFLYKKVDENEDGFRDLPTGNLFSAINRWKFDNGKGWMAQFGIKILSDRKTGGETAYNPGSDKQTTHHYGLGINTSRYEIFGKTGYVFPGKKYKSIGLQLSAIDHTQDAYFGLTAYNARQQNLYGNLVYQSVINNTNHKFRTGISFLYDIYKEDLRQVNYQRKEIVPGAFFEYTWTWTSKFNLVAGLRADHNSLYGFFATPRLHLRYEPVKGTTIRVSAGRGQRTANIFAENTSTLVSARQVTIIGAEQGRAYGLEPEVAWNKGISIDQQFRLFAREASLGIDYFRNDFSGQVVVDLEHAREVRFYNLRGASYSNSFQASFSLEPLERLECRLAYRLFDVKTNYSGQLLQRPLIARHRAFANLGYSIHGWKFDYTFNWTGSKRIPNTTDNPLLYQMKDHSPAFMIMNAEITKTLGKQHPVDIYIGAENLGNYIQEKPILAADQPFGPYFDAALIWGPVTGRMLFAGCRYKIK